MLSFDRATFNVDNTTTSIVALQAGKRIGVHAMMISADTDATSANWQSASNDITEAMVIDNVATVLPWSPEPYFQTAPGEALQLTVTTNACTGWILYSVS